MGVFQKEKLSIIHCSMKSKIMETSIISEMVSQNTICGEIEGPNKDQEFQEIAKKIPQASNKDKEQDEDQSNEGITEIEQSGKNVKKVRLILISFKHGKRK